MDIKCENSMGLVELVFNLDVNDVVFLFQLVVKEMVKLILVIKVKYNMIICY